MKKKLIVVITVAVLIGMTTLLAGCGGSSPIEGKWYPIDDDPATASGSIEFRADGEFIADGFGHGEWEQDGDRYIGTFFTSTAYTIGEVDGITVLYEGDYDTPTYAKTIEDAQTLYENMHGSDL